MSLHERLANGASPVDQVQTDQFSDVRNRVHQTVIETLGTSLLTSDVNEVELAALDGASSRVEA